MSMMEFETAYMGIICGFLLLTAWGYHWGRGDRHLDE